MLSAAAGATVAMPVPIGWLASGTASARLGVGLTVSHCAAAVVADPGRSVPMGAGPVWCALGAERRSLGEAIQDLLRMEEVPAESVEPAGEFRL